MPKSIYTSNHPSKITPLDYSKAIFKKYNGNIILLSQYVNSKSKVVVQCKICGHTNSVIARQLKNERIIGCKKCSDKSRTKSNKMFVDEVYNITQNTIIPTQKYKDARTKITFSCRICSHSWTAKPNNILSGFGCPECAKKMTTSKGEKEVADFIKSIYNGVVIENDRSVLKPKELDIYLPNSNFAIEYNGEYWHKDKPKGYHQGKTDGCASQGIKLLHIWESDWKNNKENVMHYIQESLITQGHYACQELILIFRFYFLYSSKLADLVGSKVNEVPNNAVASVRLQPISSAACSAF